MLEPVWTTWNFAKWLGKDKETDQFPRVLKNWAQRQDAVHQTRVTRSFVDAEAQDDRRLVGGGKGNTTRQPRGPRAPHNDKVHHVHPCA